MFNLPTATLPEVKESSANFGFMGDHVLIKSCQFEVWQAINRQHSLGKPALNLIWLKAHTADFVISCVMGG